MKKPDTFSQVNIQCVFAVQGRQNLITKEWRDDLHRYMHGILKNDHAFPLAINGWLDHVHVFFELDVHRRISDHMSMMKSATSKWINDMKFVPGKFRWQSGYGAFSYSRSQRSDVIAYIMNQEAHHRKISFREEYTGLLRQFNVPFKEEYLFDFID